MRRARFGERGAGMAETAIVMGVVLALLFGIIDFGRTMYTYAFVAQLARQGARWAIVRGSQCTLLDHCNASPGDVQTYIRSLSYGATDANRINVITTWSAASCPPNSTASNAPGCVVSVNVQYPFRFIAPFLGIAQINMSSTSQMVISQ
jgi:Flp pilus assembly protein TadG